VQSAQSDLGLAQGSIAVYSDDSGDDANLDALLQRSDIQAVIVALPINSQPDVILQALKAGKHVLSEKPVANSIASAVSLIETYTSTYASELHWRIAENFEVEPAFLRVRDAIRSGVIGDIAFFKLTAVGYIDVDNSKYYKTPWRTKPDYQGGFLLDGGVHSVALLRTILPTKMTSLSAFSSLNRPALPPADTINAIVQLAPTSPNAQPAHGIFELSFGAPAESRASGTAISSSAPNGTVVTGTKGWLAITSAKKDGVSVYNVEIHGTAEEGGAEHVETFQEPVQGVERELEHFFNLVSGKGDAGFGKLENALGDVAFIESALNSGGKQVELK